MTREEAIKFGKRVLSLSLFDETHEFCELAVKALEQQPCEDAISRSEAIRIASGYCHWTNIPAELAKLPSVNPQPCEDAVSRQVVKEQMIKHGFLALDMTVTGFVKGLPSVNPQANDEDIHREREQAYMKGYEDASKRYRTEPCGDAISRVAAIDKLDEWDWQEFYLPIHFKELLDELPSVSAEKTGRWEKIKSGDKAFPESIVCSRCGNENSYINEWNFNNEPLSKVFKTSKYCPNCGCHMVEPQESEVRNDLFNSNKQKQKNDVFRQQF